MYRSGGGNKFGGVESLRLLSAYHHAQAPTSLHPLRDLRATFSWLVGAEDDGCSVRRNAWRTSTHDATEPRKQRSL